ncbi:MAG TPA: hypothetical protein VHT28_19000 [Silvibacterium sp.]|nr:hypothetical protein [Silvibacterium sp.]
MQFPATLCKSASDIGGDEKGMNSSFHAGELFFDQGNRGEVAYILDLDYEGICTLCCFDFDQRITTGRTMGFGFGCAPMKAGNSRKSGQSLLEDFAFVNSEWRTHGKSYLRTQNISVHES